MSLHNSTTRRSSLELLTEDAKRGTGRHRRDEPGRALFDITSLVTVLGFLALLIGVFL